MDNVQPFVLETDELASLEMIADGLLQLHEKITTTGGMSKTFALEAIKLDENIFDGTPTAYFTNQPTATRYTESLEGVLDSIWQAILKIVKTVGEHVKKFIDWLFGKNKKEESVSYLVDQLNGRQALRYEGRSKLDHWYIELGKKNGIIDVDFIETVAAEAVSLEEASLDFTTDTRNKIDQFISKFAKDNPESAIGMLLLGSSGVMSDVTHNGPYTQMMRRYRETLRSMHPMLSETDQLLKSIKDELQKAKVTAYAGDEAFNNKMREYASKGEAKLSSPLAGAELEITKIVEQVDKVRSDSVANPIKKELKFSDLNDVYLSAMHSSAIEDLLGTLVNYEKVMDIISKHLDEIHALMAESNSYKANEKALGALTEALRSVLRTINTNINGAFKLISHVKVYGNLLTQVDKQITRAQQHAFDLIEKHLKDDNKRFSPALAQATKALKQSLDFTT